MTLDRRQKARRMSPGFFADRLGVTTTSAKADQLLSSSQTPLTLTRNTESGGSENH
jgi:hypothetical protein